VAHANAEKIQLGSDFKPEEQMLMIEVIHKYGYLDMPSSMKIGSKVVYDLIMNSWKGSIVDYHPSLTASDTRPELGSDLSKLTPDEKQYVETRREQARSFLREVCTIL
jgi:hypothetical protein